MITDESKVKLSIIMPCYNVESTIIRALDSILMQKVNFPLEIIIVNDASTDKTLDIVTKYQREHGDVLDLKILQNIENKGNAYTFYTGLYASKGEYFCVLDGDDYYTISDKLQRQVDFLDSDTTGEYVGVATQFIIDMGDGTVHIPKRSVYQEFSYVDFLTEHSGYYHTATYMYRNIFRGNVPSFFSEELYRGDTPRTTFHLMYSGKKIKVLDFVGSAYTFEFKGIWSKLNQKEQFNHLINYWSEHKKRLTTEFEKNTAERIINMNSEKLKKAQDELKKYPSISIDNAIINIRKYVNKFAFADLNFMLKHVYYSSYIDTLCASLSYIDMVRNRNHVQTISFANRVAIVIGNLRPHGGGIFVEIEELIDIYREKQVYLIVTNMDEVPEEVTSYLLGRHHNLSIISPPKNQSKRLAWLKEQMVTISPYRCYYYCSHNDPYGSVLVQKGACENVCLFSFDHGYLCGITNPNLDTVVAKRPVDYHLLKKTLKDKVICIPTWSEKAKDIEDYCYEPFHNHSNLITASGAARFYKIDGAPPKRYFDMIVSLLKLTGGKHFHFGPIPDEKMLELQSKMEEMGIGPENFVHIEWSDNMPLDLLKNNVDIFIEPFPVVSYKMTLEVLSAGIPIIINNGLMRTHVVDFAPFDTLTWSYPEEFLEKLSSVNTAFLKKASENALNYFRKHHDKEQIVPLLFDNKGVDVADIASYTDDTLMDISGMLRVFGYDFKFSIQDGSLTSSGLTPAKRRELREKIAEIRTSKSFRLGFLVTFPLRFVKHLCSYTFKYGLNEGFLQMERKGVISLRKNNPIQELKALQHSTAYKLGNAVAKPYRLLKSCLNNNPD